MKSKDFYKTLQKITYKSQNGYTNEVTGHVNFINGHATIKTITGIDISIPKERFITNEKINYLYLVLTHKWFDLIKSGKKTEEYREIKPFWKKLETQKYDYVIFQRGYKKNTEKMIAQIIDIEKGLPQKELTYAPGVECYIIRFTELTNFIS